MDIDTSTDIAFDREAAVEPTLRERAAFEAGKARGLHDAAITLTILAMLGKGMTNDELVTFAESLVERAEAAFEASENLFYEGTPGAREFELASAL